MGTRSITTVYEHTEWEGKKSVTPIVCMYRQYDGYPEGHGRDLAEFLSGITLVNGIGLNENRRIANGAGCLAAQMVETFKREAGVGGIYLYPFDADGKCDAGQDYEYEVHIVFGGGHDTRVVCKDGWGKKVLFDGDTVSFELFCHDDNQEGE